MHTGINGSEGLLELLIGPDLAAAEFLSQGAEFLLVDGAAAVLVHPIEYLEGALCNCKGGNE